MCTYILRVLFSLFNRRQCIKLLYFDNCRHESELIHGWEERKCYHLYCVYIFITLSTLCLIPTIQALSLSLSRFIVEPWKCMICKHRRKRRIREKKTMKKKACWFLEEKEEIVNNFFFKSEVYIFCREFFLFCRHNPKGLIIVSM